MNDITESDWQHHHLFISTIANLLIQLRTSILPRAYLVNCVFIFPKVLMVRKGLEPAVTAPSSTETEIMNLSYQI